MDYKKFNKRPEATSPLMASEKRDLLMRLLGRIEKRTWFDSAGGGTAVYFEHVVEEIIALQEED